MKDADYVAVATSVYREAIDAALADPDGYQVRPDWRSRLEQSFSRGFTAAHLDGRHDEIRGGGRGGHRGLQVGRVQAVDDESGTRHGAAHTPLARDDVVQVYTPWGATEPQRSSLLTLPGERRGSRRSFRHSAPARASGAQGPGLSG